MARQHPSWFIQLAKRLKRKGPDMTIKSITEIKPGDLVEVKSDKGGCDKAPCTVTVAEVLPNGTFFSNDADDKEFVYSLHMDNYIGTVHIAAHDDKPARTLHQFSK